MKSIRINSKYVERGDIFVAIPCDDVEEHISEALARGAALVFAEDSENERVTNVHDARLFASRLARFAYDKQPDVCIALTGTNGKSSTAHFLRQIWSISGKNAANLGTLGLFNDAGKIAPPDIDIPNLTTPDAITLHRIMEYLQTNGTTHFVFEASSHALEQKRLHSAELTAAGITNFASDHLDYHKTREAYLRAKLRLFDEILPTDKPIAVSRDYAEIYEAISRVNKNIISFGTETGNFLTAENIQEFPEKLVFDLRCDGTLFNGVEIGLFGKFQVMNILCAAALALASEMKIEDIIGTFSKITALEGRMEHICSVNGGNVYVDFAHTSEGLCNALGCFRRVCGGRLICVFGCGGDRDKSKRPEMGRIAAGIADVVIVTDDNPRGEAPEEIRRQILTGCPNAIEIGNRREAIIRAMSLIQPGDF
ncbi:MAG: UDP-N-acetylmuramoyl-L-alanyl-D-glutamate--2,6-diaminopimelate ligase, partial [Alphaproteobacteria bacterium]|nr:UDP-N-acetylmuramoyl-L-alanyl-D-glutamate--2,6-diaminopimelate ligase [Alphaproteobacteria bacterium]